MPAKTLIPCLIGFGSNQGDSARFLDQTMEALVRCPDVKLNRVATPCRTAPVTGLPSPERQAASSSISKSIAESRQNEIPAGEQPKTPEYLNTAITIETSLGPTDLLTLLLSIESELGRHRDGRWEQRTVDLDVLLYGDQVVSNEHLSVPHPRMSFRKFVLDPAIEIAGHWIHPLATVSLASLRDRLRRGGTSVLWCCDDPKSDAVTLLKRLPSADLARVDITFCQSPRNAPRSLDQFAIMIYSGVSQGDSQDIEVMEAVATFAGPYLIPGSPKDLFFDREILAAVQAIG